jgi:hypothetical protein
MKPIKVLQVLFRFNCLQSKNIKFRNLKKGRRKISCKNCLPEQFQKTSRKKTNETFEDKFYNKLRVKSENQIKKLCY